METKHAVIFANGEMVDVEAVKGIALTADFLIAADGGLHHMLALQLTPNMLIGDLDSVTPEQIREVERAGCEIHRFPIEKDDTDLELALNAAAELGFGKITVVAALGGRLDQTLSNVYLLNLPHLAHCDVRLDDGREEVMLIHTSEEINGLPGDVVSLLPLSPIVNGITSTGLKYPLRDEDLIFFRSRGISNVMVDEHAKVVIESGILLCIHSRVEKQ